MEKRNLTGWRYAANLIGRRITYPLLEGKAYDYMNASYTETIVKQIVKHNLV
ncbi:hypothetical protein P7H20_25505 [Paenibacillus larvae]|nr:hypothetical protein [Paenibacillus larvae]MDT2277525.1 hypothetical protein [Paenibacillus larvae]